MTPSDFVSKLPHPVPEKLYKFMDSRWSDAFLSGESIRVGTLSDFRKTEIHSLNKGDHMEGWLYVQENGVWYSEDPKNAKLKEFLSSQGVFIKDVVSTGAAEAIISIRCNEHYVLCFSAEFDDIIAGDLDSGYDLCVEIGNVHEFFNRIIYALARKMEIERVKYICDSVSYNDRVVSPSGDHFSLNPFEKDLKFQIQKEYRLAVPALVGDASPVCLSIDTSKSNLSVCWRR